MLRLSVSYVTLSLDDVSRLLGLEGKEHAEIAVVNMIATGDIHATIDQQTGMVNFVDPPEDSASVDMMERLEAEMRQVVALSQRVEKIDIELSKKPSYQQKVCAVARLAIATAAVAPAHHSHHSALWRVFGFVCCMQARSVNEISGLAGMDTSDDFGMDAMSSIAIANSLENF